MKEDELILMSPNHTVKMINIGRIPLEGEELMQATNEFGPNKKPPDWSEWRDDPSAVPRHEESQSMLVNLPLPQVAMIGKIAKREGVSTSVMVHRLLDLGIRQYRDELKEIK